MQRAPEAVTRFIPSIVLSLVLMFSTQPVQAQSAISGWGDNRYGQLNLPEGLSGVIAVAAGSQHSLGLKSDGTVVAWGNNQYGQLNVPTDLAGVTAIAAGYFHSLALKSDGTVVAWGRNNSGQTNVPVGLNHIIAIAAGSEHSLAVTSGGTVVAWGLDNDRQTEVPAGLSGVTAIAAAWYQNLALKSDGTVVAWGGEPDPYFYSLLSTEGLTNITAIAAGKFHNLALKSDGTVIAWGDNSYGQTSVPTDLGTVVAIAAGNYHSLALKSNGNVVAWGSNGYGQISVPPDLANVKAIVAGSYHNLALKDQGWPVEILSSPSGLSFDVIGSGCQAGSSYETPKTLIWSVSSSCEVSFAATQSGGAGTQYVFRNWSDGSGEASRTFGPVTAGASYTADFGTQYMLTTSTTAGGSINPATGWNDAGEVQVSAAPGEGYTFTGFSGALTGTTTPQTLVLNAPKSVTANFELLASLSIAPAAGQYSDVVTLSATILTPGTYGGNIQFKLDGALLGTVLVAGPGTYTLPYTIVRGAGTYSIEAVYSGDLGVTACSSANVMTVTREDAAVTISPQNPASVPVNVPGGTAGPITLTASIQEVVDGSPGNISFAAPVSFQLVPAVGTAPISCPSTISGGGAGGTLLATAICNNLPANLYEVIVQIGGDSYAGSASSVLSVYDSSLGSVSGVGNLDRNGARAHFNVSVRYLASGQVQGSVSYSEQRRTGDVMVDSISLRSLSVVGNTAVILGTATVNGTGSYLIQVTLVSNKGTKAKSLFGLAVEGREDLMFDPLPLSGGNLQLP